MEVWLPQAGLRYVVAPRAAAAGNRTPDPPHRRCATMRSAAYADHMESADFAAGIERLLAESAIRETAVMCSESVWWRCHRRLLADHLVLVRDVEIIHLMHDGRRTPHAITDGARRDGATTLSTTSGPPGEGVRFFPHVAKMCNFPAGLSVP